MLTKPFEIRYDELDIHAHIGPITLLRYFQEAAALDAASFAFGWEQLQEKNLAWVLTHMQLEMLGDPSPKQSVTVKTWHAFSDKLLSRREFEFTGQDGRPLARGASWWALIDVAKRRLTKSPAELLALNPVQPQFITQEENFKRPLPQQAKKIGEATIYVRREDLDLNGHVNNTHYAAWALEAVPEGKHLHKLLINFKNECRAQDVIISSAYAEGAAVLHHTLIRNSDGKEAAHAITFWH